MDLLWTVIACGLMLAGIIGSVVPLLPGPPLSYAGMLVLQLRQQPSFTTAFLLTWLGIVIVIQVLDYVIPLYGTKKFGGTRYGIWGCAIGLMAGLWFGPVGIVVGPFAGAFVGEWLANNQAEQALRAALGSFIGFVFSTLLKLVTCLVMGWYLVKAL
jgi:uncharacterized protein YqgC (DUF456 family)